MSTCLANFGQIGLLYVPPSGHTVFKSSFILLLPLFLPPVNKTKRFGWKEMKRGISPRGRNFFLNTSGQKRKAKNTLVKTLTNSLTSSVTRFGEISPLLQNYRNLLFNFWRLIGILQKKSPTLAIFCNWAKFHFVNGQILKR